MSSNWIVTEPAYFPEGRTKALGWGGQRAYADNSLELKLGATDVEAFCTFISVRDGGS
jgi:hypothetical protein